MAEFLFSANAFFLWHNLAQFAAYGLLAGLLLFVVLQLVLARGGGLPFGRLHGGSLRTALFIGLLLIGIVPAAALGVLLSERSAHLRHDRLETRIEESAAAAAHSVDRFIDKHRTGIVSAAATINGAGNFDPNSLQDAMMRFHAIYGEFLTMLCTDEAGDIVAATSKLGGALVPFDDPTGFNVSDREYFKRPMTTGYSFVSQAFRGRGLGSDPIVAISAALKNVDGKRVGVVEASLNLRAFEAIDRERPQIDGAVLILLDEQDRVIFSSDAAALSFLDVLSFDPLVAGARTALQGNSFEFEADRNEVQGHFIAAYAETGMGWKAFIKVPTAPIAQQMFGDYLVGGILLLTTALISALLATALIRRLAHGVSEMNHAVARFNLSETPDTVPEPKNIPAEFRAFFKLMRRRSHELQKAYKRLNRSMQAGEKLRKELTQVIARKEVEIAERTEELEEANRRLSTQSKRDPLTKIANRREFDAFEKRVWRVGVRDNVAVAVVLMDIDFFKIYNDKLGHQAGDDCLKRVAQVLEGCATRPLDLVARYGGEEFIAVLGGASVADALVVAERMRNAVLGLDIPHPGSQHGSVSVSVGAASMMPSEDVDPQALVKSADEALYYAKAAGRNCVVFRRDGEYVTYEAEQHDIDATNVIAILAGSRPTRKRR